MPGPLLFVCASGSSRALLAASLVQSLEADRWEVWCAPSADQRDITLVKQVLYEQGRMPLTADRCILPTSDMVWEEVIMLCSGDTAI